ncbi:NTP transferase domain-containing protein [Enterobacteriaceae bacterium H16N7]|nr:NTP transferase domain-containing protein [Dryocola clanedunensis]
MNNGPECVMLAAGLSSRMGAWKMMLPWGDTTILDSAIENALGFCSRIILVTGHRAAELHVRYGEHPQITLAYNADYLNGMFSSVVCGVMQTRGDHFFLALGDMPAVTPAVYAKLWAQRGEFCIVPEYNSYRGHPALLPAAMRRIILAAPGETTLKPLMQRFGRVSVPVDEQAIHEDIDTPAQYHECCQVCDLKNRVTKSHFLHPETPDHIF